MQNERFTGLKNETNHFKQNTQKYKKTGNSKQSNKYAPPSKRKKQVDSENNFISQNKAKQNIKPTFDVEKTNFPTLGEDKKQVLQHNPSTKSFTDATTSKKSTKNNDSTPKVKTGWVRLAWDTNKVKTIKGSPGKWELKKKDEIARLKAIELFKEQQQHDEYYENSDKCSDDNDDADYADFNQRYVKN
jgi:hypothetical protein